MTLTVVATSRIETETKHRYPLRPIDMAASKMQARAGVPGPADTSGASVGRGRRTRLSINNHVIDEGDRQHVNGGEKKKKRKAGSFHEDVGGFQFTRIATKKPRPSVDAISEVQGDADSATATATVPENTALQQQKKSPRRGRPPKKRAETNVGTMNKGAAVETEATTTMAMSTTEITGRRMRQSSNMASSSTAAAAVPETRPERGSPLRSTRPATQKHEHSPPPADLPPVEKKRKKGRPAKAKAGGVQEKAEERNGFRSPDVQTIGTSKIALPMADTPVIQRNKEMREGKSGKAPKRRSSLGMRGRRASSLIDSGVSNALPHKEVDTADFYKHIASDGLSEPRRMRQLLIWCATRALGEKPSGSRSEDESARLAARVIQEELLKDFANHSELSDWFGREDANPPSVIVRKPNPKNVQNAEKIKELEEQIQRLQRERHALNALLKQPSIPRIKSLPSKRAAPSEAPLSDQTSQPKPISPEPQSIDKSLLDPSQQAILEFLDPSKTSPQPEQSMKQEHKQEEQENAPSSTTTTHHHIPPLIPSEISSRLSHIRTHLTPTIDSFAAGIHDVELYRSTADKVSSRVLRICSQRLEERDARNALRRLTISSDQDTEQGGTAKSMQPGQVPREDLGIILSALSRIER